MFIYLFLNIVLLLSLSISNLVVRLGKPEVVIPEIIQQLGLDKDTAVVFQQEVSFLVCDVGVLRSHAKQHFFSC